MAKKSKKAARRRRPAPIPGPDPEPSTLPATRVVTIESVMADLAALKTSILGLL